MDAILSRLAEKKKLLDSYGSLPQALDKNLYEWSRIALTYNSNAIEGNTLSSVETTLVVDEGLTIGGKTLVEHHEAVNHAKAIDLITQLSTSKKQQNLGVDDILKIHATILANIQPEYAGVLRNVAVRISGSTVPRPNYLKVPELMDELVQALHTVTTPPALTAANAHLQLVHIHPFVDGNGRTASLLMNLILLQHGYPLAIIENSNRKAYIDSIEQALLHNQRENYYQVIFEAVEQGLDRYLDAIKQSAPF